MGRRALTLLGVLLLESWLGAAEPASADDGVRYDPSEPQVGEEFLVVGLPPACDSAETTLLWSRLAGEWPIPFAVTGIPEEGTASVVAPGPGGSPVNVYGLCRGEPVFTLDPPLPLALTQAVMCPRTPRLTVATSGAGIHVAGAGFGEDPVIVGLVGGGFGMPLSATLVTPSPGGTFNLRVPRPVAPDLALVTNILSARAAGDEACLAEAVVDFDPVAPPATDTAKRDPDGRPLLAMLVAVMVSAAAGLIVTAYRRPRTG